MQELGARGQQHPQGWRVKVCQGPSLRGWVDSLVYLLLDITPTP